MIGRRRRRLARVALDVELWHIGLGQCVASRTFIGDVPLEISSELSILAAGAKGLGSSSYGLDPDDWLGYVDPNELRLRVKVHGQ